MKNLKKGYKDVNVMDKTIIVGVTSSVAIHKSIDLVSQLVKKGASTYVVMTENATKLVAPLQFQTISQHPVFFDLFDCGQNWQPKHIGLADKSDLFAIVPATANIIGKMAHGIADDMLSTLAIAVHCPILIAPAMNCHMYANPIVQENLRMLVEKRGVVIAEPEEGWLACGYEGKGRLQDIGKIIEQIQNILQPKKDFSGKKVLVTAGPTREYFDPIRFITNRSSGKMGYAIAEAAAQRGAFVKLISGPTALKKPPQVECVNVETALQMYETVLSSADFDIIIMSAAVSDYRPKEEKTHKIKKTEGELIIQLERNPDILMELGKRKKETQILVGFAAETEDELKNAQEKLMRKNLDLIVVNNVNQEGAGFETDTNIVTILGKDDAQELPLMKKIDVANALLDRITELV